MYHFKNYGLNMLVRCCLVGSARAVRNSGQKTAQATKAKLMGDNTSNQQQHRID
jgi:hypothetical protein